MSLKTKLLITLLVIVATLGATMTVIEPETFSSPLIAIWWIVATVATVGYGDIYPRTDLGKIIGIALMLVGIGVFSLLISEITIFAMNAFSKRSRGDIVFKKKKHILICCDKPRAVKEIIEEYLQDIPEEKPDFVVISNKDESPIKDVKYKNVWWVKGRPYDLETLERANAFEARVAYVFLEEDADTILTCLQLEKSTGNKIKTIVKCNKRDNLNHFRSIDVDFLFSPSQIDVPLMVSSILDQGSGEWTMNLVSKTKGSANIYNTESAPSDSGKRWLNIVTNYMKNKEIQPVAIIRGNKIIYRPKSNEIIRKGDAYLVISEGRPD